MSGISRRAVTAALMSYGSAATFGGGMAIVCSFQGPGIAVAGAATTITGVGALSTALRRAGRDRRSHVRSAPMPRRRNALFAVTPRREHRPQWHRPSPGRTRTSPGSIIRALS